MRPARRVPWASKSELNELYDMVFSPDADEGLKKRGLARMSLYISSPSCPTFIHLLHTLISADLLPLPRSVSEAQSTRLSCAMAIVRFINGMVDPLQTGPYARPISHLAASLHIPASLISLRHRATHEDLPPLALLRSSVVQCISYLHTYSFLPLLAESSIPQVSEGGARATRLVARYKRLTKDRMRDREVDETTPGAKELRRIRRAMELEDTEDLVEALCTTDGIVPLARRKRASKTDAAPPIATLQIWEPLLSHLVTYHPTISSIMSEHILEALTDVEPISIGGSPEDRKEANRERMTFRWTLGVWLIWIWDGGNGLSLSDEEKREYWSRLAPALFQGDVVLRRLARSLATIDEHVSDSWEALSMLLPELEEDGLAGLEDIPMVDNVNLEAGLKMMETRLAMLQKATTHSITTNGSDHSSTGRAAAPGWRLLTTKEWRPCPIGISGLV